MERAASDSKPSDHPIIAQAGPSPEVAERLESIYSLPELGDQAQALLALRQTGSEDEQRLIQSLEMEPEVAAQVRRSAQTFTGTCTSCVSSTAEAVEVLGPRLALNIGLGFAAGRSLQVPADGPLGSEALWRHATYTGALCHALSEAMPEDRRPAPGCAYFAGFVHDFGFLLLGHLFQPEFYLLNKLRAARPHTPITELECQVLGMGQAQHCVKLGHGELGAWLMKAWQMPEEIIPALCSHHDPDYTGPYAVYPNLVHVADQLLELADEDDERTRELLAPRVLNRLGLDATMALEARDRLMRQQEALEALAKDLIDVA